MKLEFIKNILEVENDSLRHTMTYTVSSLYNNIHRDEKGEWADLYQKDIYTKTYSWKELDKIGSYNIKNELKNKYNIQ